MLVVEKLGVDMTQACKDLSLKAFAHAYKMALVRMVSFLQNKVLIPDPHAYNISMTRDGGALNSAL